MGEAAVIWGRLTESFWLNCQLFGLTLLFAIPLGLVVAFGSMSRFAPLRGVVKTFVWAIRGTPLMLQILVIYLGPGLMGFTNPWPSGGSGRLVAAVVAFAINYACYFSEIYRGGIEAVPKGQTEAGQVLGMTRSQIFFKVTLLQVVKRILPPMGNEIITLVKDTSLANVIANKDIIMMRQGPDLAAVLHRRVLLGICGRTDAVFWLAGKTAGLFPLRGYGYGIVGSCRHRQKLRKHSRAAGYFV